MEWFTNYIILSEGQVLIYYISYALRLRDSYLFSTQLNCYYDTCHEYRLIKNSLYKYIIYVSYSRHQSVLSFSNSKSQHSSQPSNFHSQKMILLSSLYLTRSRALNVSIFPATAARGPIHLPRVQQQAPVPGFREATSPCNHEGNSVLFRGGLVCVKRSCTHNRKRSGKFTPRESA